MVMRPRNYFLHCSDCGWEKLQRSLSCEPTPKQIARSQKDAPRDGRCPFCGNPDLEIRSADTLKGKVIAFLKGYG